MLLAQQLQQPVLGAVGVLVLVDEHAAEVAAVALADVGEQLEQVDGADQQVVEVHRVGVVHPLLVERVDVGDRLLEERALLLAVGLGVEQPVLRAGDLALDRARRKALRVDLELVHAALDHPQRVGLVVDREAALVAEPLGVWRRIRAQAEWKVITHITRAAAPTSASTRSASPPPPCW